MNQKCTNPICRHSKGSHAFSKSSTQPNRYCLIKGCPCEKFQSKDIIKEFEEVGQANFGSKGK